MEMAVGKYFHLTKQRINNEAAKAATKVRRVGIYYMLQFSILMISQLLIIAFNEVNIF